MKNTYRVTYENGNEVGRELIGSQVVSHATDTIIETGAVQEGAFFTGRLTTYGGDCAGGNGTSSTGIKLSPISGVQGSNRPKLTYNGRSYYCLAADPSIPLFNNCEITNCISEVLNQLHMGYWDRGKQLKVTRLISLMGLKLVNILLVEHQRIPNLKIISVGKWKTEIN